MPSLMCVPSQVKLTDLGFGTAVSELSLRRFDSRTSPLGCLPLGCGRRLLDSDGCLRATCGILFSCCAVHLSSCLPASATGRFADAASALLLVYHSRVLALIKDLLCFDQAAGRRQFVFPSDSPKIFIHGRCVLMLSHRRSPSSAV